MLTESWYIHCVKNFGTRSFSGPYFPAFGLNLDWIQRDTEYLFVFSPNAGKYWPENSEYGYFSRSDYGESIFRIYQICCTLVIQRFQFKTKTLEYIHQVPVWDRFLNILTFFGSAFSFGLCQTKFNDNIYKKQLHKYHGYWWVIDINRTSNSIMN